MSQGRRCDDEKKKKKSQRRERFDDATLPILKMEGRGVGGIPGM